VGKAIALGCTMVSIVTRVRLLAFGKLQAISRYRKDASPLPLPRQNTTLAENGGFRNTASAFARIATAHSEAWLHAMVAA
jgi:hypothetical protein